MKNKILGTANYFIGGLQLFTALSNVLVISRLSSLYQEFGSEFNPTRTYITPAIFIILGVLNLFFGHKLFSKNEAEKYFVISLVYLVITFVASGLITQFALLSILNPIYELSSQ